MIQGHSGSPSPDVIVVGGGITGCSAAAFLAAAGARVLLVERDGLASGASGANAGAIWHPFDPVLVGLYRESLGLYRDLAADSPMFRMGDAPVGLLAVSKDDAVVRGHAAAVGAAWPDLDARVLDPADVAAVEPVVAPGLWACRLDLGYPIAPASGTYGFATLAETRGVVVRAGRGARLVRDGDRVTGVELAAGEVFAAGAVIVTAGPWTPALIDPSGSWRPIRPLWGVVVEVEMDPAPRHIVDEVGAEGSEATDDELEGRVTRDPDFEAAASRTEREMPSVEHCFTGIVPTPGVTSVGGTNLDVEPEPSAWIEPLLVRAIGLVPGVVEAPIRGVRCCPRPLSADGRPLVGAVPGSRGLYVAAGHGPWGISTGPATARMVSELATGGAPEIPAELDPARFGVPGA